MAVLKIKRNGAWVKVGVAARGPAGPTGEAFTYEDFTPEQLEALRGPAGKDGKDGSPGAAGYTPQKGTDYWTAEDQQQLVNDVLAALPSAEGVKF